MIFYRNKHEWRILAYLMADMRSRYQLRRLLRQTVLYDRLLHAPGFGVN